MKTPFKEAIVLENNGKKYAFLPLCIFHDLSLETRDSDIYNQFGLVNFYETKSMYEIIDEKKFMLAKIKYDL